MVFQVPILLISWRRPDTTLEVINALRTVKPSTLYVSSDGPKNDSDRLKIEKTRQLISSSVDWECRIHKKYNSYNLGCRRGVSSALNWFFDNVSEGIVLEDDCVPHHDFFYFCSELLVRYREDSRIWCISGDNFQDGQLRGESSSYYFSKYNHCWGWATWRRCWQKYNDSLDGLEKFCSSSLMKTIYEDPVERNYWREIWTKLNVDNTPDSWAYRWTFTCISNGGLTVLPNVNLVQNIGCGDDALHTNGNQLINVPLADGVFPLVHPQFCVRDVDADQYTFDNHFAGNFIKLSARFDKKLVRQLKKKTKYIIRLFIEPKQLSDFLSRLR